VTVSDLTERELIRRIAERLQPPPGWLTVGIGDDAAVVEPERNRLEILSVDAVVEGVHFDRRFTPPAPIGHRALAVNLSDLAAMCAAPRLASCPVLPPALLRDDFDALVSGLTNLAHRHKLHVVGGNLTRSPGPLMIDITVIGTAKRRQVLTRAGARPGDALYVTGSLGGAAAGLEMLRETASGASETKDLMEGDRALEVESCAHRYLYPEPRVRTGLALGRNRVASACMDLSDGLADGVAGSPKPVAWRHRRRGAACGRAGACLVHARGGDAGEGPSRRLWASVHRPRGERPAARRRPACRPAMTRIGICTAPALILRRSSASSSDDAIAISNTSGDIQTWDFRFQIESADLNREIDRQSSASTMQEPKSLPHRFGERRS
jgi:thiamin-phosphate kinase